MAVALEMQEILIHVFEPVHLELIDQSDKHIGHAGHDGKGESHFLLKMTSAKFDGLSKLERQRMVNVALAEFLNGRIHALTMKLKAPE